MPTIKLTYSSMRNINFRGEIDTGIDREEWADMTPEVQDEVVTADGRP